MSVRFGLRTLIPVAALAAMGAAAAEEAGLTGTFTQNQACKGGGQDPANKLVTIGEKEVVSSFGPCVFRTKEPNGKTVKAQATCRNKTGVEFDVDLLFTLREDGTVEFLDEGSQYKSVLYRCPAGTPPAAAAK
jgi:hypothetical protein